VTLIIGIGNPDRGDDAAGILAARHVHGGRVIEWADCSTLLELWEDADEVIVIDAMRSGRPPGTTQRFDAWSERLPAGGFVSTHAMGVAETVEMARVLDRLPRRLLVYGIEASDVTPGAAPSPEVYAAAVAVAAEIDRALGCGLPAGIGDDQ
jgi:hydrogenase maturation protease